MLLVLIIFFRMSKAPIKVEGYIGNIKVCNDLIVGSIGKSNTFTDAYSKMLYVGIDGIRSTLDPNRSDDEGFGEILCPITDFSIEQQTIERQYSAT